MPVLLEQVQRIELDGDHTQHHDSLTDGYFSTEPNGNAKGVKQNAKGVSDGLK